MKTLEQQIKSLGCGVYAVEMLNQGRIRQAVVNVPTNVRTQVRLSVIYQKDGYTWVKRYKVKGDGISLECQQIANESFIETWTIAMQNVKGQVTVN